MSEQEMKFTEEGLKESIKNGDIETIEKFVSLSDEVILSQLGVDAQYDDLLDAAVDTGNLKMVKTLLKRSNLIQASMDNFIDGLDENDSEEIKEELRKFAGLEKRSNLQTHKGKWNEWQAGLKKAKENGYDDLAEKLENRMQFENDRRLEMEGKRPNGTSENRWLNEKSWFLKGKDFLEYPMYGQDNSDAIREELKQAGIETEYMWYEDKKTNTKTDYRIRIKSEDKEKLKEFLEQKRQEKEDLEAIVSNSNDEVEAPPKVVPKHTSPDNGVSEATPILNESINEQEMVPEHSEQEVVAGIPTEEKIPETESVADHPSKVETKVANSAERTTFRDLNNLDTHMSPSEVLARLEDVELKENETDKKVLLDEMKRQYQLKRGNPNYKVQGLNGRVNTTDMLAFAQHIDNVIDDGEMDNIDYTRGHTEKIRSLATLDRHLQIDEVLARLEDVSAKTQDPNEQALLDLVREAYEEKRNNPQNDISGLNSFVDSTAAVNLAKRIDLAIDDGEIENVDCHIMDTIQVADAEKSKEKDIVQDNISENISTAQPRENLPLDPNDLPKQENTAVGFEEVVEQKPELKQTDDMIFADPDLESNDNTLSRDVENEEPVIRRSRTGGRPEIIEGAEKDVGEQPADETVVRRAPSSRPQEDEEVIRRPRGERPVIEDEEEIRRPVDSKRPEVEDEYKENLPEGAMMNGPGFEANWHKFPNTAFMSVAKGSFQRRPYYFNPNDLSDEEKRRAMKMLTLRGIYPKTVEAPLDFDKGPKPIKDGEKVWVVEGNQQIKRLKEFFKASRDNKEMAMGLDLYTPIPKENEKSVDWKGGAKKVIGGTGKAIKGAGNLLGKGVEKFIELDSVKSLNATMDKFNKAVFETSLSDPEQFASNMMVAMLAFPFDFLDIYLKTKADKYKTAKSDDKAKSASDLSDDKKRQKDALKKIMGKMVEKDPELFYELAEKGVLGPKTEGMNQEEKSQNAQQILMQPENEELMNRLKATFGKVTKENPELIQAIYPADYKGAVTPDVLLNHVMGWDKENNARGIEQMTIQPQQPIVPVQPSPIQEMQAVMEQMQLLTAELKSLREEVAQLRQENAQLKEQMMQLSQENAQLRAENEALRSEKAIQKEAIKPQNVSEQPKKVEALIPDLNKLGSLNNLNETMARNIMDDDVPGFKETASMTPEQLAQSPKAQFFNKVRSAYSTGEKPAGLNDLVQTTEQAGWAEELAKAVENDNGDNVPRIKKELIPTTDLTSEPVSKPVSEKQNVSEEGKNTEKVENPQQPVEKQPAEDTSTKEPVGPESKTETPKENLETSAKPVQAAPIEEAPSNDSSGDQKGNQMTPEQVREMVLSILQEIEKNGYSVQKADVVVQKVAEAKLETKSTKKEVKIKNNQERAKKLVEKTEKLSKKKDTLTKAQRDFVRAHLGLQGIDLNKRQDGFVYKDDGSELSDHAIKQVVGHETTGKYARKAGLIELFQKLHTLDKEVAAQYGFEFKEVKKIVKKRRGSLSDQKKQPSTKITPENSSSDSPTVVKRFLNTSRN